MEDLKVWKLRKVWYFNVKETDIEIYVWEEWNLKLCFQVGGVRYYNGLVQVLGYEEWNVLGSIWGRVQRKFQNERGLLWERDGFFLGLRIRGSGQIFRVGGGYEQRFL